MIIKWMNERKAKKAAVQAEIDRQLELDIKEAKDENETLAVKMESKPCSINGFKPCSRKCIHFEEGAVYPVPKFFDDGWCASRHSPVCKLWGK